MIALPRFRPNRVRPDEAPELVASRNFDGFSATLEKAFGIIESDASDTAKALTRKANSTNPVIRGLLTLLGGVADLSQLSVTGDTSLTSANGTILADATGGSLTLNLPAAATSKGLLYQIHKVDLTANTVTVDANGSETIDGALTVVLGGNIGNSRLFIICDGAAWRVRELYEEGTYPATLTGCTTSPTATVSYVRNGKQVTLRHASIFATSNSTACTLTGMPSHIYPGATTDCTVTSVYNAGNAYPGIIRISTSGVVTPSFYDALTAYNGTFTNSATNKGFANGVTVTYIT